MKIIAILTIAAAVLVACTVSLQHALAQSASGKAKTESPFYCNRKAIKPEQTARKEELDRTLLGRHRTTRELENGYEFELTSDPSTIQATAEWAALEKLCCPFFDIDLRLEREQGPFFLRLSGREGVKQFIRSEFAPLFRAPL